MAESISTPTKISPRNPVCRLCGESHESRYMLRIFSKAGSSKDLCVKVHKTCGIKISEDDMRSRLCFIRKHDGTVYSESPIHREYAVRSKLRMCCKALRSAFTFFASTVEAFIIEYVVRKLCAHGGAVEANHTNKKAAFLLDSTSCANFNAYINRRQLHNPFCGSAEAIYFEVCITVVFLDTARCYRRARVKRTWLCTITSVDQPTTRTTSRSVEQPSFPTAQQASAATVLRPKSTGDNDCTSLFEAQSLLTERQQKMIVRAVSHRDAAVLAAILRDHCPGVVEEVKKTIREELKTSCAKLCKRSQGSVLYENDYDSMKDFDFNKIWLELKTNLPYLVEHMNAVSGKENSITETKLELQVKYSFLYSILMNERWHELSFPAPPQARVKVLGTRLEGSLLVSSLVSSFSYFYFQLEFCKECKEPFRRGHSCTQNQSNPTTAPRPSVSIRFLKAHGTSKRSALHLSGVCCSPINTG